MQAMEFHQGGIVDRSDAAIGADHCSMSTSFCTYKSGKTCFGSVFCFCISLMASKTLQREANLVNIDFCEAQEAEEDQLGMISSNFQTLSRHGHRARGHLSPNS
jgi:hypothetical protein